MSTNPSSIKERLLSVYGRSSAAHSERAGSPATTADTDPNDHPGTANLPPIPPVTRSYLKDLLHDHYRADRAQAYIQTDPVASNSFSALRTLVPVLINLDQVQKKLEPMYHVVRNDHARLSIMADEHLRILNKESTFRNHLASIAEEGPEQIRVEAKWPASPTLTEQLMLFRPPQIIPERSGRMALAREAAPPSPYVAPRPRRRGYAIPEIDMAPRRREDPPPRLAPGEAPRNELHTHATRLSTDHRRRTAGRRTADRRECFQCRRVGHIKVDCPRYRCGGCRQYAPGHVWRLCPTRIEYEVIRTFQSQYDDPDVSDPHYDDYEGDDANANLDGEPRS